MIDFRLRGVVRFGFESGVSLLHFAAEILINFFTKFYQDWLHCTDSHKNQHRNKQKKNVLILVNMTMKSKE